MSCVIIENVCVLVLCVYIYIYIHTYTYKYTCAHTHEEFGTYLYGQHKSEQIQFV